MLFNKKQKDKDKNASTNTNRKNKKGLATVDIIMLIFSLMLAVALWIYVYDTTNTLDEKTFNLVSIEKKNTASLFENHNLVVQYVNIDTVNVTVMGSKNIIESLGSNDINAYINLGNITDAGEYKLEVMIDLPEGVTCKSQTVPYVEVTVDSSTEKNIKVTVDNVILSGWSLEEGYSFGEITTNLTDVKLEGALNDINKISSVGLVTGDLGSVRNSMTSICQLVLLDSNGNRLNLPNVYVTPNINMSDIMAHITVYQEKRVPLVLSYTYGYIDESCVSISPSYVTIKGEAASLENINSIVIGNIDEGVIPYPVYEVELAIGYDGVQIFDDNGNALNSAKVKIDRSSLPSRIVTGAALYRNGVFSGYAEVLLVARHNDDSCKMFLSSISAENIRVYAQSGTDGYAVELSDNYFEYLYQCGVTPMVGP